MTADVPAGAERVLLEGYDDLPALKYPAAWYADRIRAGGPFAFVKRTHGFWDRLVELADESDAFRAVVEESVRRASPDYPPWNVLERALRIDRRTAERLEKRRKYKGFWEDGFVVELVRDLRDPPASAGWIEAQALRAYTNAVFKPAIHAPDRLRQVLLALAPRGRPWHYALTFKDSVVTGEFRAIVDVARSMPVIVVGPRHLRGLGQRLALPQFRHVEIHETDARSQRDQTLATCRAELGRNGSGDVLVMFQAGSLSWWLMRRLYADFPRARLLDLGRVLDIWFPEVAGEQRWFLFDKPAIVKSMGLETLYPA